jgi:hypothetical protein
MIHVGPSINHFLPEVVIDNAELRVKGAHPLRLRMPTLCHFSSLGVADLRGAPVDQYPLISFVFEDVIDRTPSPSPRIDLPTSVARRRNPIGVQSHHDLAQTQPLRIPGKDEDYDPGFFWVDLFLHSESRSAATRVLIRFV